MRLIYNIYKQKINYKFFVIFINYFIFMNKRDWLMTRNDLRTQSLCPAFSDGEHHE